ncbi:hypothetical protein [Streptomyces murinus]
MRDPSLDVAHGPATGLGEPATEGDIVGRVLDDAGWGVVIATEATPLL